MSEILGRPSAPPAFYRRRRTWLTRLPERFIGFFLLLCATASVLTTIGIVSVLIFQAVHFFGQVSIFDFLSGTRWTPLFASKQFGVLALLAGTFLTAVGAMVVALPLGVLSAIYLSEYAPELMRRIVKPVLEVLAGIPTVVYGYFALLFVTPILRGISEDISVFNAPHVRDPDTSWHLGRHLGVQRAAPA